MGEIACESTIGIRMAILTGLDNSVESHMRVGIIHFSCIVGTVTIGTLGCLKISQSISFPVNSFRVGFRKVLMAGATLMGHLCHELILLDMGYLVSRMAVFAVREFFRSLGNCRTMNGIHEILIDAFMACGTGCREIFVVNGSSFIIVFQDEMRGVTVRADSTGQQAFLDQAFSVDAAGIVDHNCTLFGSYSGLMIQFPMTVSAELGYFGAICSCPFIQMG
jgi:hypothetical protein